MWYTADMRFALRLVLNAFILLAIAYLVKGVQVDSFVVALVAALLFAIVNIAIKPIVHLIALPITILSLGLFALIINALLFWIVSIALAGFSVEGFLPAFLGAFLMSVGGWLAGNFAKRV